MASQTSAPNPEGSRRFGLCLAHPSARRAQSSVWSLAHGDVIITKATTATGTRQDRTQQTLMGRKTKEALVQGAHGTSQMARDPWLDQDPWQTAPKTARTAQQPQASHRPDLHAEIERQVLQAIKTHGADHRISAPKDEGRLEALEKKVGTLEQGLTAQQQQTHQIADKIGQVQQHVATNAQQAQRQLDQRFAEQLAQIDALLSKRGRHEGHLQPRTLPKRREQGKGSQGAPGPDQDWAGTGNIFFFDVRHNPH